MSGANREGDRADLNPAPGKIAGIAAFSRTAGPSLALLSHTALQRELFCILKSWLRSPQAQAEAYRSAARNEQAVRGSVISPVIAWGTFALRFICRG
uniref:Uncharacterized protein n=1 Tax=Klebsiella pneumoniae TaxID=573 RepID=A0A3G4RJ82_KLEPN|nr:hypothetical protein [Klebsiella pneumoniae]